MCSQTRSHNSRSDLTSSPPLLSTAAASLHKRVYPCAEAVLRRCVPTIHGGFPRAGALLKVTEPGHGRTYGIRVEIVRSENQGGQQREYHVQGSFGERLDKGAGAGQPGDKPAGHNGGQPLPGASVQGPRRTRKGEIEGL